MLLNTVWTILAFSPAILAAVTPRDNHGWCYCKRHGIKENGGLDEGLTAVVCANSAVDVNYSNIDHKG
ncbi:hypothetical protein F66182_3565 [Fusarium sp. NRRL 66182]|nr:hypothetical protein F66182_3565 [Fusarium sp. NRRL 66182]